MSKLLAHNNDNLSSHRRDLSINTTSIRPSCNHCVVLKKVLFQIMWHIDIKQQSMKRV